jgi:predicted peptidase
VAQVAQRFELAREHLDYLLHLPLDYGEPGPHWPLLLFLHGRGERGGDLDAVRRYGIPKVIEDQPEFPMIAVSPQCPLDASWTDKLELVAALLDEIVHDYNVDERRVYLSGLSMGGQGAYALALKKRARFAALAVVCGRSFPERACDIAHIPSWIFHGARDTVVPLAESEAMASALRACGAKVTLTVYPELAHNAWDEAYGDSKLYRWLLEQRLSQPGT